MGLDGAIDLHEDILPCWVGFEPLQLVLELDSEGALGGVIDFGLLGPSGDLEDLLEARGRIVNSYWLLEDESGEVTDGLEDALD